MPTAIMPMHPTLVAQPFHHEGWLYEEKVDGYRVLAHKDGDRVRLISRHAKDLTARFPELAEALRALRPERFILDGEVAVYDEQLISRFEWLRRSPRDQVAAPPMMMVFVFSGSRRPICATSRSASAGIGSSGSLTARPRFFFRLGAWPTMASRPGRRCSSAATRAWWRRIQRRPTSAGARCGG